MTDSEIWSYIEGKPGWITLSTAGHDGYPHSVPIGYFVSDHLIYIGCVDQTQKVKNIERNPRISLMLHSGTTMDDIKGVLIKANAEIIRRDEDRLALSRLAASQRGNSETDLPTSVRQGSVYIKASPASFLSWNYAER
jgi:nitroimidazol reductase NimA-like FMN-containing flavoprotein (pyridoxamine 5'-phosphate oxidase superfamily)